MKNKIKNKIWLAVAAAFLMTAPAYADKGEKSDGHHKKGMNFESLDTDGDSMVSRDEFIASHMKRFDTMDTNADGNVSQEEIDAYREAKRAARKEKRAAKEIEEAADSGKE